MTAYKRLKNAEKRDWKAKKKAFQEDLEGHLKTYHNLMRELSGEKDIEFPEFLKELKSKSSKWSFCKAFSESTFRDLGSNIITLHFENAVFTIPENPVILAEMLSNMRGL